MQLGDKFEIGSMCHLVDKTFEGLSHHQQNGF